MTFPFGYQHNGPCDRCKLAYASLDEALASADPAVATSDRITTDGGRA